MKKRSFMVIVAMLVFGLSISVFAGNFHNFHNRVAGTYLITTDSGQQRLWTFTNDGNVLGACSAQAQFNFSNQQGTWKMTGDNEVTALILNFDFGKDGNFISSGRMEAVMTFGKDVQNLKGSFTLRKFKPQKNSMDPGSVSIILPIEDDFTGQRVTFNSSP